jgi:hypothetical protein
MAGLSLVTSHTRGVLAMRTLMTLVLAVVLGAATTATAATMSCLVDTPALDRYTPENCTAVIPGAQFATASFRIDPPLPQHFQVFWSDARCNPQKVVCNVTIGVFVPKTMTATVLNVDTMTFFQVSATADFENGQ